MDSANLVSIRRCWRFLQINGFSFKYKSDVDTEGWGGGTCSAEGPVKGRSVFADRVMTREGHSGRANWSGWAKNGHEENAHANKRTLRCAKSSAISFQTRYFIWTRSFFRPPVIKYAISIAGESQISPSATFRTIELRSGMFRLISWKMRKLLYAYFYWFPLHFMI